MNKLRIGIVGATGLVGQQLIALLADHPWFEITAIAATERHTGRRYRDAVQWMLPGDAPEPVNHMMLESPRPGLACDSIFSVPNESGEGDGELAFAEAGFPVISCTPTHRMESNIPLIVADVNPYHLEMVLDKDARFPDGGFFVSCPHPVANALSVTVKPLLDLGIAHVHVVSLQPIMSPGAETLPLLDYFATAIPFIEKDEERIRIETRKILGEYAHGMFSYGPTEFSAHAIRVPVWRGSLLSVSVTFQNSNGKMDLGEIEDRWKNYQSEVHDLELPSASQESLRVFHETDRPQPQRDYSLGQGTVVAVGQLRESSLRTIQYTIVTDPLLRGGAGNMIMTAELLYRKGYLTRRG